MKLLCVYKHYWPDVAPYGVILKQIAEHLAECGHDVTVFSAQPTYNDVGRERQPWRETVNGVRIHRVRLLPERKRWTVLRAFNLALFISRACVYAFFHRSKFDILLFHSFPPVMMGVAARAVQRMTGLRYIYHCQDAHPEALEIAGKLRKGRLYDKLRQMDAATCRLSALTVAISNDMRDTILERDVPGDKVAVITNFSARSCRDYNVALPAPLDREDGGFNVLFAGNIGAFQNLDEIADAAAALAEHDWIRFLFMGEGTAKLRLMERLRTQLGKTVVFLPHQPIEVAFEAMKRSHLGLVSLSPGVYRVAFPTKTMMYLAAGCPVLAVIEPESQLAKIVTCEGLGYSCSVGNPESIANTVLNAYRERDQWDAARRAKVREAGERLFGRAARLKDWAALFERLEPSLSMPPEGLAGSEASFPPYVVPGGSRKSSLEK